MQKVEGSSPFSRLKIRPETPVDAAALAALHRIAFGAIGADVVALVDDLRCLPPSPATLSLIAEAAGEVVGHAMVSPGSLDGPARAVTVGVLSPVAVRPEAQRRGIATALVGHGLAVLGERGVPAVFLEGDPAVYRGMGFAPAGALGFGKPSPRIPDRAFQVALLPAYERWMTGSLVYPAPFWRHDLVGPRAAAP